jgi:hypothetical protein
MLRMNRGTTRTLATSLTALALLAGCIYSKETTTERQVPVAVAAATTPERVVTYPEGRYVLYGDGTKVPYYWVWTPSGVTAPMPPPPPPVPTR